MAMRCYPVSKCPLIWFLKKTKNMAIKIEERLYVNPEERLVNVHYKGKALTVLSHDNNDVLDGYGVVPGLRLPLREIF